MCLEIKIPQLNANEDELLVTFVAVEPGDYVETDDELFVVESTKTSVDVLAEKSGYISEIRIKEDEVYKVGFMAMKIVDSLANKDIDKAKSEVFLQSGSVEENSLETAKSRLLKRKLKEKEKPGVKKKRKSLPLNFVSDELIPSEELTWVINARGKFSYTKEDDTSWDFIDEERRHKLNSLDIGKGSFINFKRLFIGNNVKIGKNVFIEAEDLYIGDYVKIGDNSNIVTGEVVFFDGVTVAHNVEVDLSGGKNKESRLLVGPGALISSRSLLNASKEILLEKESAVSPGAMIFTHSYWQSVLDGYPCQSFKVRLCENSWIGAGCQVLPGTIIGKGAVVMSNSTVINNVQSETMYAGVPAEIIKENLKKEISRDDRILLLRNILDDFIVYLEEKRVSVEKNSLITVKNDIDGGTIALIESLNHIPEKADILIFVDDLPENIKSKAVFDIKERRFIGNSNKLIFELRNFFRRYGIRFSPCAWDSSFNNGFV
ncbi:MAG: biotin/lipoyl-containing protein [Candidatus Muiribacteriota bacterium]